MADTITATTEASDASAPAELEGQTYEIIRKRLQHAGGELRAGLAKLNESRKAVFGSIETELIGTERVTTDNNCIPRDLVAIGDRFLFGYNVHVGLRSHVTLADVFSVYRYHERTFESQPLEMLGDEQFQRDFDDLYKYYKETRFARFALRGPHLFMVFRIGKGPADIKTFKWAIDGDRLVYLDNRSDHQFTYPPQHEFAWTKATRDQYRFGVHPHVSIDDRVFVEAVGGDLTVKVENNTDSGEGIYAEDVDNADQTLDDADVQYSIQGNLILMKVLPYQERDYRYLVFNEKIKEVRRIDAIADSCVLLPDDHGLIFPNGYYLQTGEYKTFDLDLTDMMFEKRVRSSNGEDVLFVFFNRLSGTYVLLSYNLISQEVSTPTVCSGYAFFGSGELLTFRHQDEPQKHHALQIWQTPYLDEEYQPHAKTGSMLYKIGNRELVRGMAECNEVLNLLTKDDTYGNLYFDLVKRTGDIVDSYFWIDKEETGNLKPTLVQIRDTAAGAISEFEKVTRARQDTAKRLREVAQSTKAALSTVQSERFEHIDAFVRSLAELRTLRGEIISLRDLRYVDLAHVDRLDKQVSEEADRLAGRCVEFLLQPDSLAPYA
ncbi:MAG: DNA repair ATPase, partial [Planctomycetales bacterium]|nr:DNA repair ATPase [Planctomycetales bacterium]